MHPVLSILYNSLNHVNSALYIAFIKEVQKCTNIVKILALLLTVTIT